MSDLSWLNPTPHAIAVYASQPLSPVATQHSLPSGRYSLLGPVFHRLDRTSFAWRTHSITSSARASSVGGTVEAERPGGLEVDDQLEFGRLHNRKVGGLCALEDATGIDADLSYASAGSPRSSSVPGFDKLTKRKHRGKPVEHHLEGQLDAPIEKKGTDCGNEDVGCVARKALKGRIDLTAGAGLSTCSCSPKFARNSLHVTHSRLGIQFCWPGRRARQYEPLQVGILA